MAGIIEKIRQYFVQLELEQQRALALAATQSPAPPSVASAATRGLDGVPRRSASISGTDAGNVRRLPSVTCRRLSLQVVEQPHQPVLSRESARPPAVSAAEQVVPPLPRPLHPVWGGDGSVSDDNGESLASWRSLTSPSTSESSSRAASRGTTEDSDPSRTIRARTSKNSNGVHVVPRKKSKKRKPPSPANLERQIAASEREKSERVANGLVVAQERARRIQEETQQEARARRQERREAIEKIKAQLDRIEEVRVRRSSPQSLSIASSSYDSMLGSCSSSMSRISSCTSCLASSDGRECLSSRSTSSHASRREPWSTANSSNPSAKNGGGNQEEPRQPYRSMNPPAVREMPFLAKLETRTREQMLLQLQFRKKCLDAKKRRERLQHQLSRTLQANESKHAQVAGLEQAKDALGEQLSRVLEEINALRKQRHELEEAGRNERLRRQKEAERALQRRLREEEWIKLMDEEKARSVVAVEAREKASERVQKARGSTDKHLTTGLVRRAANNVPSRALRPQKPDRRGSASLDFIASLGLELAEFEEEGLYPRVEIDQGDARSSSEEQKLTSNQEEEAAPFEWLVPSFDRDAEDLLLTAMVSDSEEE